LTDNETKSLNRDFEIISISDGTDSSKLGNMRDKVYATKNYQTTSKDGWLEITDPFIMDLIMKHYGDPLGRKILLCATDAPKTIMDILLAWAIPQTTGYRKILKMIEDQMLIPFDTIRKNGGKRISRYITTFAAVQINIIDKVIRISARPNLNAKIKSQVNFLKRF
jgi:hypothetical protein